MRMEIPESCQRDEASKAGAATGRLAVAALGLLISAAMLVLWRRSAGALAHPLGAGTLLVAGIAAATAAAAVRVGWWLRGARPWALWPDWAIMVLTSLATAGLVVGLWLPGTRLPPILAVALLVLVEEMGAAHGCRALAGRSGRLLAPEAQGEINGQTLTSLPLSVANALEPLRNTQKARLNGESAEVAGEAPAGGVLSGFQILNCAHRAGRRFKLEAARIQSLLQIGPALWGFCRTRYANQ